MLPTYQNSCLKKKKKTDNSNPGKDPEQIELKYKPGRNANSTDIFEKTSFAVSYKHILNITHGNCNPKFCQREMKTQDYMMTYIEIFREALFLIAKTQKILENMHH